MLGVATTKAKSMEVKAEKLRLIGKSHIKGMHAQTIIRNVAIGAAHK